MNIDERLAPQPDDGAFPIEAFEVSFAIPVYVTFDDQDRLRKAVERIVKQPYNQLRDGVHWLAGCGAKPTWSQADAVFLGKPIDPDAPTNGEPTFASEVYFMETAARPFVSDKERVKVIERRNNPDPFATPTVVCLCGSTRFGEAFRQANLTETLAGKIVLSIGCDTRSDADLMAAGLFNPELKERLDILHLRKIDIADEVLILNVGGYIGESTRKEIDYAKRCRKRLRYLEEI